MGTLGTGDYSAALYARGGTRKINDLPEASLIKFRRSKNQTTVAEVTMLTGSHDRCCGVLGQVASWGHEVVIFRNGQRVWEGPVVRPSWRGSQVVLQSRDVSVYRERTPTQANTATGYVVNHALDDLALTFAASDPNVYAHVQAVGAGTGPATARDVKAYGGDYADQAAELVKAGLCWTTVGRRIVLWPSTLTLGRTSALVPDLHLSGEVEVYEDGMALATGAAGVNDAGEVGTVGGVDPFYGSHTALVPSGAAGTSALTGVADQHRSARYPAPLIVAVPAGSVLTCDAPFDFSELVPGVAVPVKIEGTMCRDVSDTQELLDVDVTVNKDGEQVAITLGRFSGEVV